MHRSFFRLFSALLLIIIVFLSSQPSPACGPFALDAVFTFTVHPEFPLDKFAKGELGVLEPTYARSYLFVAYRYLNGNPLSSQEQAAVTELWRDRLGHTYPEFDTEWPKPWIEARKKVPGVPQLENVAIYRHREKPNEYDTYVNCQVDAFDTAAKTLEAHIKEVGAGNPDVKAWVLAQDEVFANCSEGQHMPPEADTNAQPWVLADRKYQIAGANFYMGNFDEATKLFDAIAKDGKSLWRIRAPYLAARAQLRKGSLGPTSEKEASLTDAEKRLKEILSDSRLESTHQAAVRLMNLVQLRLHPDEKLRNLAISLSKGGSSSTKQDLWDYTVLLDQFLGDSDSSEDKKASPPPDAVKRDDLSDWITTFESPLPDALNHSLERFAATKSTAWLLAALNRIDANHPKTAEILAAASRVRPDSPGFAAATYGRVRLMLSGGKANETKTLLDEVLTKNRSSLTISAANLLLAERMRLATNLSELLKYAQRQPAGFSWNEDDTESVADTTDDSEAKNHLGKLFFDVDGAQVINQKLPLSLLAEAAQNNVLPQHLRLDVAQAAWTRAIVLDDSKTAMELVPVLQGLAPKLKPFLDDYLLASDPDEKRFIGIYTWLKFPGMEPVVDSSVGRTSPIDQQDTYRDNWWCSAAIKPSEGDKTDETKKNVAAAFNVDRKVSSPQFLTAAQRNTAQREWARISSIDAAPNYLSRQVLAWAEKRSNDPRVPEALHLAVKSTRYGCTDKDSGKWSKAAFDFLHKRYPNNPWTKKTPYWFKE